MSIACYALHIRHPRAHILPSLTATCQVCTVSLKAGLSTYNRFARRALYPPDGHSAQTDAHIMGMACEASAAATEGFVFQLKAQGQHEGEDTFEERLPIAQQLEIRRFALEIDGDGTIFAGLASSVAHGHPSGIRSRKLRRHNGGNAWQSRRAGSLHL